MHGGPAAPSLGAYGRQAVEVEGGGRNKAQLIVGIDFVSFHAFTSISHCGLIEMNC